MKLRLMAISDTHLGEDSSILSYPLGRQYLWRELRRKFGEGNSEEDKFSQSGRFDVDELILVGDIPDRTLSSTSQITEYTNAFMRTLGSAARIKKVVYVPGNHDHTIWTDYIKPERSRITHPAGEAVLEKNVKLRHEDADKGTRDLLFIFFGYRHGSLWRAIAENKDLDFVIANPLYATKLRYHTYVFAHGTHFRKDVNWGADFWKWAKFVLKSKSLGKFEIRYGQDPKNAEDLSQLEKFVTPLVDSLWHSAKDNPTSLADHAWWSIQTYMRIGEKVKVFRSVFWTLERFLIKKRMSIELFSNVFLDNMREYLRQEKDQNGKSFLEDGSEMAFIYGDTHDADECIHDGIRIFNCGGWTVHDKNKPPETSVFVVYEDGKQELVKIEYKKEKEPGIDGKSLIALAAKEFEHKNAGLSKVISLGLFLRLLLVIPPWTIVKLFRIICEYWHGSGTGHEQFRDQLLPG